MPKPLALGWTLTGGVVAGTVGSALHSLAAAPLAPYKTLWAQKWWKDKPILLPDPGAMLNAFMRGYGHISVADEVCRRQGVNIPINWEPGATGSLHQLAWKAVARSHLIVPSPAEIVGMFNAGLIGEETFDKRIIKAGGNINAWWAQKEYHLDVPGAETVLSAYARRRITLKECVAWIKRAEGDVGRYLAMLPAHETVLSGGQLLELRNRSLISDDDFRTRLELNGIVRDDVKSHLDRLRERIPGPGDLVHFATREAFKPDIANKLGLYDEYPALAKQWMDSQGLHASLGFPISRDGAIEDATWLDMYWASHWIQPSAGQIFQMRHRFRPSRMKRFTDTGLKVEPFDQERVRQLLKLIDYPPWARDYLTGLSFTPLRLIDIRNAYRFRIITREEAIEQFQDRGVHPDDAKVQADLVEMQEQNKRYAWLDRLENNLSGQVVREILASYEDGIHTQEQAAAQLNALIPYTETVNTLIHLVESRLGRRLVREGIRSVRRDFINGTLSVAETQAQLAAMGIVDQRIAGHIALWTIQRNRTRRMASTAQIVGWVGKGMLHPAVARQRLLNLGWDEPDVVIMLDEQAGKLAALDAKRRAVADKAARTRAKELESLQRTAERQRKSLEADQRRATPRSTLDRWLCNGEISETFYLQRMRAMGYPSRIAHGYLIDAKRKKACAPAPEGSPFPSADNVQSDSGDSAGQSTGNGAANP